MAEMKDTEVLCRGLRVPGGRDREGRPVAIYNLPQDRSAAQSTIRYLLSIYSEETRRSGIRLVVDGHPGGRRAGRILSAVIGDENVACLILRPEAFWDKSVDHCAKSTPEPIFIPPSRLQKYIDLSQLPEDFGGTLSHDRDQWLRDRVKADLFFHESSEVQTELDRVTRLLTGAKEGTNNAARTMTQTRVTYNNTAQAAAALVQQGRALLDDLGMGRMTETIGQDVLDTRQRLEREVSATRGKLTALQTAWGALNKSIADAKEVEKLETGVKSVTEWLLTKGEELLATHCHVGFDITSAEQLRREHEQLELSCRETYGQYAELLHKLDCSGLEIPSDLRAQRDFMDFVIRGFASRLERRRNILISSARFFRLVAEYFQTTSEIYEKLVMIPDVGVLDKAQSTLLQLQDSQNTIDELEEWVMREGEKLSDLLSMPVKDSLGREVTIDYGPDITNISEILEMSRARSELFRDNVELQRITLQQASHVFTYENDAAQAIMWLDELFEVMLMSHAEVGCSVYEIQRQKEEQQNFEETAKCTYEFGSQLLRGALLLRQACKLGESENRQLSERLTDSWLSLTAASQAHMTRLRVTAVFHRDIDKHCAELKDLIEAAEMVKSDDLKELLNSREAVLLEVARMIRLARLLKSRLREPLCPQQSIGREYNRTAVEAISERVAEVTALAEQLDLALCGRRQPSSDSSEPSPSQEDWYGSLEKSAGDSSSSKTCEEEEFVTASECTCTPPSRSSSFHTASEGYLSPWWSDTDRTLTGSETVEVVETQKVRFSKEGCTVERHVEGGSEVSEWLELKVLEVTPELTQLGSTLKEAEELRRSHHEVISKIQSKKSPVEELVDQAEAVISRQGTSPRVYSAMSRSITSAWDNVNSHLQSRSRILDLNVNYHRWAEEFDDCCTCTEVLAESELPVDIDEMRSRINEIKSCEREALTRLGRTLAAGAELLGALKSLRDSATLDSRPDHIKLSSALAIAQVEGWMELLHERRIKLQDKTSKSVTELEECLELALITSELMKLQRNLEEKSTALVNTCDQLGDTSASASLLLHEHCKLLPEAKEMQEQSLKIVRFSEEFSLRGHFAGPEAVTHAYVILEQAACYVSNIGKREENLQRAIAFFTSAEQTLIKLDQLEVQLSTAELGLDLDQLRILHEEVSNSLEEVTDKVLQEGYKILEETPTAEGVKRMVEEIENKKINLSVQCTAHKEENIRANAAYKIFIEKYNLLNAFLTSLEGYLSGVTNMGDDLVSAREFLQVYKRNLNDLQTKTLEIKALISSAREVGGRKQTEIADTCLELESRWCSLSTTLESRVNLVSSYVRALSLSQNLNTQLDAINDIIKLRENESKGEQLWVSAKQLRAQMDNTATNFNQDSMKDSGLDTGRARGCLEDIRLAVERKFGNLEHDWEQYLGGRREEELNSRALWDDNMAASHKTVDWVSKLYDQLYPALNPELHSARQLAGHVEQKLNAVLPEIKRALTEIQLRQETAQALLSTSDFHAPNDSITDRLRDLSTRLNAISADYQVLLEKMLTFFNNISQIENQIERGQREEITSLRSFSENVESFKRSLDADRRAVAAMFDLCHAECALLLERIKVQEGPKGESDVRTVETCVENLRYSWQRLLTTKESKLSQMEKRAAFDLNLREIERSLESLSNKLITSRGYGESLNEALSASRDFEAFETTIQLIEVKINDFLRSGQDLCNKDGGNDIERELSLIQQRWNDIKEQVKRARSKIQLTIQLYSLVQEAENWFKEGNHLLTTIVHRSTFVKTYAEVNKLLQELENFFKPGEQKQNERISEISRLADELYGAGSIIPHSLHQVKCENKEMFDTFSHVSSELRAISDKLKSPSPQPIIQFMDVDGESIHSRTVIREYSSTLIQTIREGLTPSPAFKIEEIRKTPSPPPKKVKVVEDIPPSFSDQLTNATVNEGSSFVFNCKVTGKPTPQVRWEKDGVMIDEKNTDYKVSYSANGECSLRIEETFTEDSARFSCIANNSAGSAVTTAVLSVVECWPEDVPSPPVFITPLNSQTFHEGSEMNLRCLVSGVPLPTVQWYHGKLCIDNEQAYNITYNNGEALLKKEKVTLKDDGEYSCIATNVVGSETNLCRVFVKCKSVSPLKTVPPPKFISELTNVMARAGQKVRLDCEVANVDRLEWTHDGRIVNETPEIKLIQEGTKVNLVITEAFPKDAGVYSLKAINKGGSTVSTGTLTVKGRLPEESSDTDLTEEMEPARPVLQVPLKDQSVFEGKKVRLDCVIVAQPEPEVIWYHNNQPVKESPDIQLVFHGDRCSLIIEEALVEDSGTYRVVAINSAGEATSQCTLNVTAVDKKAEPKPTFPEVVEEGKPVFKKLLSDTLVKVGDTVCLECVVDGKPTPTVTWSLNNTELLQSNRIHMSQDAEGLCLLKIKDIKPEDRGVYTAKATNQLGEAKCFSQLIVKTPVTLESLETQAQTQHMASEERPAFKELFSDMVVTEGSSAKFECIVTGKPTPKVKWFFNDEPVSGKDFLISTSGFREVLTIPEAKKSLSGKVTCIAENSQGKASLAANLLVVEGSKFVDNIFDMAKLSSEGVLEVKKSVVVESSKTSHFSSSFSSTTGGPKPHVEIKSFTSKSEASSQKIGDKPPVSVEMLQTSEYRNIDGVESKGESSYFKSLGLEKSSSKSNVEKSPSGLIISKRKDIAPRFMTPLNGCIVDQERPIFLEAVIDGHPTPEISWTRNNGPIPSDAETSWSLGKATLRISSATTQHGGRYSLTASNTAGSASSSADVVVKKSSFPPVLGRRLQAKTPVVGERLALEIEVTGTPNPSVSWSKDGKPITAATLGYRTISQGHCHSLVVDKVDHSHSGQYSATASNCAGEAKSIADVLVIDPPPLLDATPSSTIFSDLISGGGTSLFKSVTPGQTHTTTFKRPGESVVVEESFQSQKHVSMKVQRSEESFDSSLDIKKDIKTEPTKIFEIPPPSTVFETPKSFQIPKPSDPPKPFVDTTEASLIDVPPHIQESKNEDLITESISTKSSLDFFKSIIRENEEEKKRMHPEPKHEPKLTKTFEPVKLPTFSLPETPKIKEESKLMQELTILSQNLSESSSSYETAFSDNLSQFNLEPGPPPEIGYIPKAPSTIKTKEEVVEKAKKLQETHRQLSEVEVPSGAVRIFPMPSSAETKNTSNFEEKKVLNEINKFESFEKKKEVIKGPLLRPSADVPLRPSSPKPSAEGVAMEKLWTTKLEHKPALDRPKSPVPPSVEGLAMDKLWSHKHVESNLPSVWPPTTVSETSESYQTTQSIHKVSESKKSSFQTSSIETTVESPSTVFQPKKVIPPPLSDQKIIYVAEAHTTHRTNIPSETIISKKSSEYQSSQESAVVTEKTLLPSEAKKFWPPDLPLQKESPKPTKELKAETKPIRSVSMPQGFSDIVLEPGPPPEIGFATPPPKERRTSYVEQIEQDLEKDLEKEPSKHLVGAVRTIPPPKRESSVESLKSYQRSNSLTDEVTFKSFKFNKYATMPRPSKFVKKNFESDYESDLEGTKIKARWTPWDSDTEEPTYRKVKPPLATTQPPRPHSAQPAPVSLPTSLPIQSTKDGKRTPQDSGYMADTDEPRRIFKKSHHTKSEKIIQSKQEKVIMKQEKKIEKKEVTEKSERHETFPFNPVIGTFPKVTAPLPASPSKFIKSEFKESDYESDYETRIKTSWRPSEGVSFRPVHPPDSSKTTGVQEQLFRPQPIELKPGSPPELGFAPPIGVETSNTMKYAETTGTSKKFVTVKQTTRVLSGIERSQQKQTDRQTSLPTKFVPKGDAKWSDVSSEAKRLQRVEEMRRRFGEKASQSMIDLRPGEPPQFDYAPPSATTIASKQFSEMGSTFKSKAQQFVSDVVSEVKLNGKSGPILKQKEQKEPEVYREESRVAEHGAAAWTSGGSSAASSPIVVNQMLHCQQPSKPPVFITPLRDIAVVSGGSARFECIVEANPQPTITWSKAGVAHLGPGAAPAYRNGVCRLDIPRTYQHDAGRYTCRATNSFGTAETSGTLSVTGEERTYISS
ncbi:uncharacterized protein [Halyomorpha halys]|uniref:uncharacterized protein isoform X3 n=1 Tax=Halyomorpha halys TaxID=286706 RepID=UPI0006D52720